MTRDNLAELHTIIASRFREPRPDELTSDVDLGPAGFGLDSISLVELLLICEEHFGVPFPFSLFDDGPMTVGRLVAHAQSSRQTSGE